MSRVLQSKLSHDIEIPIQDHLAFAANVNSHYEYIIAIQEQDIDSDGNYVNEGQIHFYNPKSVWNGVQNLTDWLDFNPSDYLFDTGVGDHKWLTDGPTGVNYRDIDAGQSAFLYYIGTEDNAPKSYVLTTYDDFNAQGTQLSTIAISNPFVSAMTAGYSKRYARVAVGTHDIPLINPTQFSSGSPATVLNGVKSYSIRLWDTTTVIGEVVTFNVSKNCSKYTPIRLHWMNRLGGFDAFNFDMKSEGSTKVDRKSYHQQHRTFTGAGWSYDKMDRGRTEYDIQTTKKKTINTGYINDLESVWMESLFTSAVVYQELNNELIAVNIDGRSIKEQTSLNNKLSQYTFDIEYSLTNYRARG